MASNGIDKPVLNAFRMLGLLGNQRVKVTSSGALPPSDVVADGVRGKPDVNAIATRRDNEIAILVWNYHDDDLPAAAAPIDLVVEGLPANAARGLSEHFRIDANHSNAFTAWQADGFTPATVRGASSAIAGCGTTTAAHFPVMATDRKRACASAIRLAPTRALAFAHQLVAGASAGGKTKRP